MTSAKIVRAIVVVCAVIAPVYGVTSVLAWDVPVCGQTSCRLGASVRATLINDTSEYISLRHPSRNDVAIDLSIRPLFKYIDLFFKFHRNFSNLYETRSDESDCMYSSENPSDCAADLALCCLTRTERAPGRYCLKADDAQSYSAHSISALDFVVTVELNVTVRTANGSSQAVVAVRSGSNSVAHSAFTAQLSSFERVPVSSLATLAQTLLLFVPRDRARDWFVVDSSSAVYPRLSLSAQTWVREVSCAAPQHWLTATQSLEPRDQYRALQQQRWEQYYAAVDSRTAQLESSLSTMRVNYTASNDYQLTMLVYYD